MPVVRLQQSHHEAATGGERRGAERCDGPSAGRRAGSDQSAGSLHAGHTDLVWVRRRWWCTRNAAQLAVRELHHHRAGFV